MSQNDFEENGVEQSTLQALQETWQKKLSTRNIAQFPWDPAPTPPAPVANPPTVPSNAAQSTPVAVPRSAPQSQGDVRIKTEPTYENGLSGYPQNPYTNGGRNVSAQQRAVELLQQQYGTQANASIGALQQQGLHLPARAPGAPAAHRQQGDAASNQQYLREQEQLRQQQREITNAQTDGGCDDHEVWNAVLAYRRSKHNVLRAYHEEAARRMDAGLMMPPRTAPKREKGKKNRTAKTITSPRAGPSSIVQLDGTEDIKDEEGDREELDEDAINSDLDDSGDELNQDDEDDEGNSGEVMLCTYDKVQRVKNKWKCTLKDGVLTTGGKEYLYHKAQGEFEW
ncbi:MAG: transcription factor IIA subunit alpha [Bathelium mastoideum]|nr:MAG: transcription factor IIA subunit alpha [Bathelium mastoideum]KAI9689883.1 MAG: transcription factor IIA subunit alpha [Bathelium mastoideum]